MNVLNFIGVTLPQCDQGDHEYYCFTMLTLFKLWQSGYDLKGANISWDDVFSAHLFNDCQLELMRNFNV